MDPARLLEITSVAESLTTIVRLLPLGEAHRPLRSALTAQAARDDHGWSAAAGSIREVAERKRESLDLLRDGLHAASCGSDDEASAALSNCGERLSLAPSLSAAVHQSAYLLAADPRQRLARLRYYARARARTNAIAAHQLYLEVERDALRQGDHEMVCAGLSGQSISMEYYDLPRMQELTERGLAYVEEHIPESAYWRFIFVNLLSIRARRSGDTAAAVPLLEEAVRLGDAAGESTIDARKSLAQHFAAVGDHDGQVREIRAALAQPDEVPLRRLQTLISAARILGSQGHFDEANRALDEAAWRIDTDTGYLNEFLLAAVIVYSAQGDPRADDVLDRLERTVIPRDKPVAAVMRLLHGMANEGHAADPAALRALIGGDAHPEVVRQIEYTARRLEDARADWTPLDFWR